MSPFPSIMRRFSRSSSVRKSQQQQQPSQDPPSYTHQQNVIGGQSGGAPPTATTGGSGLDGGYTVLPNGGIGVANEGRPISSATDASFDFANRPVTTTSGGGGGVVSSGGGATMSSQVPQQGVGGGILSRTDQIVLKHFWESKHQENTKRDLHYLKFPYFPQHPGHRDLLPYCEIYHLVKTSPGANIISLGSADGVYIGFELQTGSQLHIDLDDDWFVGPSTTRITHHRVAFRPYSAMIADPTSVNTIKSWPKPLTIEFLEEQYQAWCHDLMSPCWQATEIRELGASSAAAAAASTGGVEGASGNNSARQSAAASTGGNRNRNSGMSMESTGSRQAGTENMVDDGYASERSDGRAI